jgi:hypothetical protein
LLWVSPASAAESITVTPNTDLGIQQVVHVDGAGFPASVQVGFCQAVVNGTPDQNDCADAFGILVDTSSETGTFSADLSVRRFISVPSLGRTVDCAIEACYVGAAVFSDIANTAVFSPITFSSDLADGRIRRRSDGVIFGDNVYGRLGPGENREHAITAGGFWTYALQVQNDGPATADLTVTASTDSTNGPLTQVQFFFGYFDITSSVVSSGGFTFRDMSPGEVHTFALQFHEPSDTELGAIGGAFVNFASGSAGVTNTLKLSVVVSPPV